MFLYFFDFLCVCEVEREVEVKGSEKKKKRANKPETKKLLTASRHHPRVTIACTCSSRSSSAAPRASTAEG